MKIEDKNYVVVFRTRKPEELDMAKEALTEASIPYYAQHEAFVGLIEAMPEIPLSGPDVWSVQVPQTAESTARKILVELLFEIRTTPDMRPALFVKNGWRAFSISLFFVFLIWLLKALV